MIAVQEKQRWDPWTKRKRKKSKEEEEKQRSEKGQTKNKTKKQKWQETKTRKEANIAGNILYINPYNMKPFVQAQIADLFATATITTGST